MAQLQMLWPESRLSDLPTRAVPEGYDLRFYRPGDEPGLVELMGLAGFEQWKAENVKPMLSKVLPDGLPVVVHQATGRIIASATATHEPTQRHPFGGCLGWVAVDPEHRGKGLGYVVCAAATRRLLEAGYRRIYLDTDDWRLPALKTYLKLGWVPYLFQNDMPGRWRAICEKLGWPFAPEEWPRESGGGSQPRSLNVYVCTDLEGVSGVTVFEQTRDPDPKLREEALHLLMGDVNAAVQGCLDGGAMQVVVLDGHGGGFNFIPSEMHPGAQYVTGVERTCVLPGLDDTFDAMMLVGYHAMMGTQNGILHHTQSSKSGSRYWYNDIEMGELGQEAIISGHYGVPIVMVSGDTALCEEARNLLGDGVVRVAVKEGYGRQYGKLLPPQKAHELIREGAKQGLGRIDRCKPYAFDLPIRGRLQFSTKQIADNFKPKRAKRVDDRTFEATFESALDILKF